MKQDEQMLEQVIDVLEGRVVGADADAVMTLVATDPRYAEMHRFATQLLANSAELHFTDVPASTRAMLESLMPSTPSLADHARQVARSVARLIRSSAPGAAFAGARGASATHHQLVFDADGADLVVELDLHDDHIRIAGQVLGATGLATLELVSDEQSSTVVTDEFGDFVLRTAPSTALHLLLHLDDDRETIVDLTPFLDPHGASA